jgi:uncharacterized sulfatase
VTQPNIVFLFSDQQRWDTLGCLNPAMDFTPNLDQLAGEGVLCRSAFTCQPVCGPARACLQTGRYATELGCWRNGLPLPRHIPTLAGQLRQSGYETAYIGKLHLANTNKKPVPPARRAGYEHWLAADTLEFTSDGYGGHFFDGAGRKTPFRGYRADCQTDFVIDFLERRTQERPFFLFVSWLEPHHQNGAGHFQGPPGSRERFADYEIPGDLRALPGDWAEEFPDYLGCCAALDANVGRIVHTLKEQELYDDTLLVYASDHGCHFRTRNGEYKRSCHDASLRVPLILRGPGFTGGQVWDDMVSLLDLPATLLRAAGAPSLPGMRGNALQRLAEGKRDRWPEDIFAQISESQVDRTLRTRRWKYAVTAPGKSGWHHAGNRKYREAFLYDLKADPHELRNLVREPSLAPVRDELRLRLLARMREAGERETVILSA